MSKLLKHFTVFLLVLLFLVACVPAASISPTPARVSKTPTPKVVTFTASPSMTSTATPTLYPLPVVEIPATPTPSARVITVTNIEKLEVLDTFGNGIVHNTVWSPSHRFLAIDTSRGWKIYNAETFQPVKFQSEDGDAMLEWSQDGKFLATVVQYTDEVQPVRLYDGETLELIKVLRKGDYFAWSPSGSILTITDSSHIYLYNPHSLKQTAIINTGKYPGINLFSPDEKTVATLYKGQVRLWDAATGKLVLTFENVVEENDYPKFAYSADGKNLLVLDAKDGFNFKVSILNSSTGKVVYTTQAFLSYRGAVNAVFSPNGHQMALQTYDKVSMIDVNSGKVLKTISLNYDDADTEITFKLVYSADGKKLITTAGIFDVETGRLLNEIKFASFIQSPDGGLLVGSLYNKYENNQHVLRTDPPEVWLWDVEKNQKISAVPHSDYDLHSISFSADEKKIVTFDEFGNVLIYNIATGERLSKIEFDSRISSISFGPKTIFSTGYLLAICEETGKIQIWDTGNHQVIHTFLGAAGARQLNLVAISPNGQMLAYHARKGGIEIADIFSGKVLRNLALDDDWINHLVFSPDGQMLIVGSANEGNLSFWNVNTGDSLDEGYISNSDNFDFSLNGNQLISADDAIHLWDITAKKTIFTLTKENLAEYEFYSSAALSADGYLLAAGTSNDLIYIWDVEKHQLLRTITSDQGIAGYDGGANNTIKRLVFSTYNHILFSWGAGGSWWAWDADTGLSLPFGVGGVFAFSPDGSMVVQGYYEAYLMGLPTAQK